MKCKYCGVSVDTVCLNCRSITPLCETCLPKHLREIGNWVEENIQDMLRLVDIKDMLGSVERHNSEYNPEWPYLSIEAD